VSWTRKACRFSGRLLRNASPGHLSNYASLSTDDADTLTLTATSAYEGIVSLESGTLKVTGEGTINPTKLTMLSGTTLDISGATAYAETGTALALNNLVIGRTGTAYSAWTAPHIAGNVDISGTGHNPLADAPAITYNLPSGTASGATLLTVDGSMKISNAVIKLAGDTRNISSLRLVDVLSSKDAAKAAAAGEYEKAEKYASNTGTYDTGTMTLVLESDTGEQYELQIDPEDPNDLLAVLTSIRADGPTYERMKAYAESRIAGMAMINQGQDLIIDKGMASAIAATGGLGMRVGAFGAVNAGKSKYKSGSTVDVESQTLLAGIGVGGDTVMGRLAAGLFFEAGQGKYETKNDFSDGVLPVKGKGNMLFYGGGALARLDAEAGLYFEGSGRAGRVRQDFNSSDIMYGAEKAKYEVETYYFGAHGGVGYVFMLPGTGGKGTLDLSGKILWSHLDAADVRIKDTDLLRIQEMDSVRVRAGGRLAFAFGDHVMAYAGGHWEREFEGAQKAKINDTPLDKPTIKGDTWIGEAGITLKPSETTPFYLDVGAQAFEGVRTGYQGSVQARLEY
jgi:outer membrane autotransporter protein